MKYKIIILVLIFTFGMNDFGLVLCADSEYTTVEKMLVQESVVSFEQITNMDIDKTYPDEIIISNPLYKKTVSFKDEEIVKSVTQLFCTMEFEVLSYNPADNRFANTLYEPSVYFRYHKDRCITGVRIYGDGSVRIDTIFDLSKSSLNRIVAYAVNQNEISNLIDLLYVNDSGQDICCYSVSDYTYIFRECRLKFENPAIMINNKTYINLRDICAVLGYEVLWDEENEIAIINDISESEKCNYPQLTDFSFIKQNMTSEYIENIIGIPIKKNSNSCRYKLQDGNEILICYNESQEVASVWLTIADKTNVMIGFDDNGYLNIRVGG